MISYLYYRWIQKERKTLTNLQILEKERKATKEIWVSLLPREKSVSPLTVLYVEEHYKVNVMKSVGKVDFNHCGLVKPYGNIDQCQHWLR